VSGYGAVRTATGGMRRHKVQTIVIAAVLLTATASATLGFTLLAASNAPFQHAFAAQHGADVTLTVNSARASTAQLDATRSLRGVVAGSGPFPEVTVQAEQGGQPWGQLTLVGRPGPSGPVDDLVLNAGHWITGPGQIVLSGTPAGQGLQTGARFTVTGVPGNPVLTVVGFANSITSTADGWVAPAEIAMLGTQKSPVSQQMLYRFSQASTNAQVLDDIKEVSAALPPGAVAMPYSWLAQEDQATGPGAIMEPFVVAFALIGLVMAVLIVGNVISGAVVAGYHRIGVLKSIGLTPAQVVLTYLSRVGWPALAGCVAGVAAGNALTMLAGLGPALRAGRLSATQAITAGQDRGDARRDRVRHHRAHLRGRAALLAGPGGGQPDPVRHGPGADPAERPGQCAQRRAHRGPGRRGDFSAQRAAGHAARGRGVPEPAEGRRHARNREHVCLRRRRVLDRIRHHQRPLVRRSRRGGFPHVP
jgi:putative ABC transport system permease protein